MTFPTTVTPVAPSPRPRRAPQVGQVVPCPSDGQEPPALGLCVPCGCVCLGTALAATSLALCTGWGQAHTDAETPAELLEMACPQHPQGPGPGGLHHCASEGAEELLFPSE